MTLWEGEEEMIMENARHPKWAILKWRFDSMPAKLTAWTREKARGRNSNNF